MVAHMKKVSQLMKTIQIQTGGYKEFKAFECMCEELVIMASNYSDDILFA